MMSTHIVATQHGFDELLDQVKRTLLQNKSVEVWMDSTQEKTPLHTQLEQWGLSPWPSDERMKKANLGGRRLEEGDPDVLHLHAWIEQVEIWLRDHADPIDKQIELSAITDTYQNMVTTPISGIDDVLKINRVMWGKYRVLAPPNGMWGGPETWMRPHKGLDLPDFVRTRYNLPAHDGTAIDYTIPNVFADGSAYVASNQAVMGALKAIYRHPTAETSAGEDGPWTTWANGVPYCPIPSRKGTSGTAIYMRYGDGRDITATEADQLWRMARDLDDWTADTFLSCIAQAVDYLDKGQQSPDGLIWIDTDTILGYRGLAKKMKDGYSAGYKPEDRIRIGQCMGRLEHLWVRLSGVEYIEQQNGKKIRKALPEPYDEGRLLAVMKRKIQPSFDGPGMPIAWGFMIGDPLKVFISGDNRMVARLSKKALQYHETNERWERRLAVYCMIYMRVDAKNGHTFRRRVGTLIEDIGMRRDVDQRNPERTRKRLHKALNQLVADGIIGAWDYAQEVDLPPRKWLEEWLTRVIIMQEPADTLASAEHKRITDKTQRQRESAQRLAETAQARRGKTTA